MTSPGQRRRGQAHEDGATRADSLHAGNYRRERDGRAAENRQTEVKASESFIARYSASPIYNGWRVLPLQCDAVSAVGSDAALVAGADAAAGQIPGWIARTAGQGSGTHKAGRPRMRQTRRPVVWIHAVSVGEVLAIAPMVARSAGAGVPGGGFDDDAHGTAAGSRKVWRAECLLLSARSWAVHPALLAGAAAGSW